ncbi:hypothetical protein AUQ37_00525 [Candidatus Methanomethylophilus sp. 1R26]|nr:hypothetical protein AUQ37_00525 [Candidatus Methanomethylophilus sp. 1R26]
MLQFPSADTMQGPIGEVGLHAFPNMGHCSESIRPRRTWPQLHPLGSSSTCGVLARMSSHTLVASYLANLGFRAIPDLGMTGNPRHLRSTGTKVSSMILRAFTLPSGFTSLVYSFSISALPSFSWRQSM